jgi:hypothetical protein
LGLGYWQEKIGDWLMFSNCAESMGPSTKLWNTLPPSMSFVSDGMEMRMKKKCYKDAPLYLGSDVHLPLPLLSADISLACIVV